LDDKKFFFMTVNGWEVAASFADVVVVVEVGERN